MLFEELSIIIGSELNDPKLALAQVTDVRISRDLRNARVYVHGGDDDLSEQEVLWALQNAIPYIRSQIAVRSTTRSVPEFIFYYDDTPERAQRIDALLAEIAEERGDLQQEAVVTDNDDGTAEDSVG